MKASACALAMLLASACQSTISYRDPEHKLGVWRSFDIDAGAIFLPTSDMRIPTHFVDTGTPRSRVARPCDQAEVALFDGVLFKNVPCADDDADSEPVIGNDMLSLFSFWFALDQPQGRYALNLSREARPADPAFSTELIAGDAGEWPIVLVTLEGHSFFAAVDTGSVTSVVRTKLFDMLVADARPETSSGFITWTGPYRSRVTRARSLSVAGAERGNVLVSENLDSLLDAGSRVTGLPVDGIVGTDFLRWFVVNIDAPNRRVNLYFDPSRTVATHPLDSLLQ